MNRNIIPLDIATKPFVKRVIDEAVEDAKLGLRQEIKKNHEETMEKLDSIMGEFKKFDEEHTLLSYRFSEHSDQLENHEGRLKKIETLP